MGSVEKYPEECFADVVDLLAAGTDVVTTGSSFIDTYAVDPGARRAIESACQRGDEFVPGRRAVSRLLGRGDRAGPVSSFVRMSRNRGARVALVRRVPEPRDDG